MVCKYNSNNEEVTFKIMILIISSLFRTMQWIEQKGTEIPKSLRSFTFPNTQQEIICTEKEWGLRTNIEIKDKKN
jgi:hypothetical protein